MKKIVCLFVLCLFAFASCKKENSPPVILGGTGTLIYAGKTYKTITINGKEWIAENLAYLPVVYPSSIGSYTDPCYYVYGYAGTDVAAAKDKPYYTTYGVLYNWPAAKGACPPGWHLPSDGEWKQLEIALGMTQEQADAFGNRGTDQGTQMKATSGWNSNGNGTNSSGFSALPAGARGTSGTFGGIGNFSYWWSSPESTTIDSWIRSLDSNFNNVGRGSYAKMYGFSVRCVRD